MTFPHNDPAVDPADLSNQEDARFAAILRPLYSSEQLADRVAARRLANEQRRDTRPKVVVYR